MATEQKNGKIRVRNAKFVGKRITQDEFIAYNSAFSSKLSITIFFTVSFK